MITYTQELAKTRFETSIARKKRLKKKRRESKSRKTSFFGVIGCARLHVVFRERELQKKLEKEKELEEKVAKQRTAVMARFSAQVKAMNYTQKQQMRARLELERRRREEQEQAMLQQLSSKSRQEKIRTVQVS
jgi:hypothetical protein